MSTQEVALRCSYYMLTTISTIGYGDFLPHNIYEMSFLIVVML
jgi:Ion channel.